MRAMRKRFKPPVRKRTAVKIVAGREVCLQNDAGRAEKKRRLWRAWKDQSGICAECNLELRLVEAQFERQEFQESVENRAIHRRCQKKHKRHLAENESYEEDDLEVPCGIDSGAGDE